MFIVVEIELLNAKKQVESADGIGTHVKSVSKLHKAQYFHGTKIPLQKWFLAIALMLNAKKTYQVVN